MAEKVTNKVLQLASELELGGGFRLVLLVFSSTYNWLSRFATIWQKKWLTQSSATSLAPVCNMPPFNKFKATFISIKGEKCYSVNVFVCRILMLVLCCNQERMTCSVIIMIIILSFDIAPFPYKYAQRRITFLYIAIINPYAAGG